MSVYRESPEGMPEPPRRGNWDEACPHGFLAKWHWVCEDCHQGKEPVNVLRAMVTCYLLVIVTLPALWALAWWGVNG